MTAERARLIVNPSSGRERGVEYVEHLSARIRERYSPLEVVLTAGDGDAERAGATAVADGCRTLFIAGGDGTVNEAVNGVASAGGLAETTFGILPFGTGNDFATALGIPLEVDPALDVLLAGRSIPVDLGQMNGRCFFNTSGGGFVAEVSVAVTPQLKTIAGRLAYLIGGAQSLLEYEPVRATVAAEPGGERIGLGLYAFAVCNSRLIGGGRLIAPHALIDDGLLDLCAIEAMSTLEFVALATKVAGGDHVNDPRVRYLQASTITLTFDRTVKVNTDGEVMEATACEYRVLPRATRFLAGDALFTIAAVGN
ncbi:MAG TPA: diacylglycerol kinase family protein, partial [Vicinamibacterales bacterium]|nr:diacylglycerol kinase family protein [Vicinamibacterales bacterium]